MKVNKNSKTDDKIFIKRFDYREILIQKIKEERELWELTVNRLYNHKMASEK
jgi:hypothetical protein